MKYLKLCLANDEAFCIPTDRYARTRTRTRTQTRDTDTATRLHLPHSHGAAVASEKCACNVKCTLSVLAT